MNPAPEPILDAALLTLHRALVHARNLTCRPDTDTAKHVNDLMEALHEIPDFLAHWDLHDIDELRLHLRCFDHTRWPGAPNLVQLFDSTLGTSNQ
jgi:hypothetical protein